jgi:REP element-mobilizing transposase RayT
VGAFVGQVKSRIVKRMKSATPVWQRNYYEHVIRDEKDWETIRLYIEANPSRWSEDEENP